MKVSTAAVIFAFGCASRTTTVQSAPFGLTIPQQRWIQIRGGEDATLDESPVTTEETIVVEEEKPIDVDSLIFGATKPGDGSEEDPDGIPGRFLNMAKGNREKAKAAFDQHLKWREEHSVDDLLKRPQPKFDLCKKIFPVYIPGRDQQNNVVVVQRVGLIDIDYGKENGISGDDLLMYYIFMIEYCWNILDTDPFAVMTTVMDLEGVRLKTIRDGQIRNFLKKFVGTMSHNYPNRSHKTLIINAPNWINMAYNLVKPLLRSSTKEKIQILNGGHDQDEILISILGADHVPKELLKDPTSVETNDNASSASEHVMSEVEQDMRKLVSDQIGAIFTIPRYIFSNRFANTL